MKFVVMMDNAGQQELFTFPRYIDHDAFAKALESFGNYKGGRPEIRHPIFAGFIDCTGKNCVGESVSLKLKSSKSCTELLHKQLRG